ncbi:MAG: hypothetical protein U5K56_15300 [Halioglobus sp.]|nr:hypothetical protein [Halioglobus sp.]
MTTLLIPQLRRFTTALGLTSLLFALHAAADGPVGEHVNDLEAHLDEYSAEVVQLIDRIDGIVGAYDKGGLQSAKPEAVVEAWESVKFHSAIETHHVPLYASVWQGLVGVRTAIEQEAPIAAVRAEQEKLEQALWQSLGAVKLAARYQKRGLLPAVEATEAATPAETIDIIQRQLDRVVAKYAEQLTAAATGIVHDTYLQRFEGIEGQLIEQDAELVEDLEVDFNVTLPKALQDGAPVDKVRQIVEDMQAKLERAKTLLEEAEQNRADVF